MGEYFDRLKERLIDVNSISRAGSVLSWDQQTYMPPGGARARAEQMATLARISHELFTSDETGEMLQRSAEEVSEAPYDSFEASLVRVAQYQYEKNCKLPADLVSRSRRHAGLANPVWVEARRTNDYASFAPYLETTIELSRETADALGYEDHLYDALLDQFEPGMKAAQVRQIFGDLKTELVPMVEAIRASGKIPDASALHQPFDEAKQEEFGMMVVQRFGYDLTRGRQDRTIHPFAITFSRNDVRITTRFDPNFIGMALFGTMHESGHAMYEQGVGEHLEGTLLARGASLGVHESQSRLWENIVGRSRPFWEHFYPRLQDAFPDALGQVSVDTFYRAINAVQPSLIRVESDEVTYNLHIMLRFEMELGLLDGDISVEDAPGAWNEKMEESLGVRPPNDTLGILQDTHWSSGMMGYFPTYSLGNILSVQLFETATAQQPAILEELGQGEFGTLHTWLTENLYRYGKMFQPNELIERATGQSLSIEPYVAYLKGKFGELYSLPSHLRS